MNHTEWMTATRPDQLLAHVSKRAADRQYRLFAAACVRRAWHFVTDERLAESLRLLEAFADGTAKARDRTRAHNVALKVARGNDNNPESCVGWELWGATEKALRKPQKLGESAAAAFGWVFHKDGRFDEVKRAERAEQVPIVRDMFRHSTRKIACRPEWLTSTVRALAAGIYDERAFDRMPILADALMDAGCANDEILAHLRDNGQHVRGCWALDLLLGKA